MTDSLKYGKPIANFILNDFKGLLNKRKLKIENCPLDPEVVGFLVKLGVDGYMDKKKVKELIIKFLDENIEKENERKAKNQSECIE